MPKKILIIDDDPVASNGAKLALEQAGYLVSEVEKEADAIESAKDGKFDLIVIDLNMGGEKEAGYRLMGRLPRSVPKIIWSGWEEGKIVRRAFDPPSDVSPARGYIFKSESNDALVNRVRLEFAETETRRVWIRRILAIAAAGFFILGVLKLVPVLAGDQMNQDVLVGVLSNLIFGVLMFILRFR